jgi:hypothetical protein
MIPVTLADYLLLSCVQPVPNLPSLVSFLHSDFLSMIRSAHFSLVLYCLPAVGPFHRCP